MSKHSARRHVWTRVGAALAISVSGIALAAGAASASHGTHAAAFRLTATLTPSQEVPAVQAPALAGGHFHGVLLMSGVGAARIASLAGCKVIVPPRRLGLSARVDCGGAVGTLPASPGRWRLIWRLSVSHLGSPVTGATINLAAAGNAAQPAFALCGACRSTMHGTLVLDAGQAASISNGSAYVNVSTVGHPGGEVRGQITRKPIGVG